MGTPKPPQAGADASTSSESVVRGRRTVKRSISFPPKLVERLDGLVATGEANSLSELVTQATRELLRSHGVRW
jgi:hypothetical protein